MTKNKLRFVRPQSPRDGGPRTTRVYRMTSGAYADIFLGTCWKRSDGLYIWETKDGNWDGCEETRLKAADALDKAYSEGWTKREETTVFPFATISLEIDSVFAISAIVERLIRNSQWFAVMPLPDDKWEITTKIGVDLAK